MTKIRSIGIATRDRPAQLARCLEQLADALAASGRTVTVIVVDDSASDEAQAANAMSIRRLAERTAIDVRHLDRAARAEFADQLAVRTGVPRDVVGLALAGQADVEIATGASRNVLLLASAGELAFQIDDDIVWRPTPSIRRRPGIRTAVTGPDPTTFEFHPNRAAALGAVPRWEGDGFAEHERVLGRSLSKLALEFERPAAPDVQRHLAGGTGRVIASSFGIAGDAGMWSPRGHLLLRGESRDNMLIDYERAACTRDVVRAAPVVTIQRGGLFMAGAVGLDNQSLLPPFFPVGRNQDGVFAVLAMACIPDGYMAHLPWTVVHDPPGERAWARDAVWRDAGSVRLSAVTILSVLVGRPLDPSAAPADQMMALAQRLAELAAAPPQDFAALLGAAFRRMEGEYLGALDHCAREVSTTHRAYHADVARQREQIQRRMAAPDYLAPIDLLSGASPARRLARAQSLLADFARVLAAWPALWSGARALQSRGEQAGEWVYLRDELTPEAKGHL